MKRTILAAVAALLVGCAGHVSAPSTTGGYLAPKDSPYYQRHSGVLYAWDGTAWYVLRQPAVSAGYVGGAEVGQAECWSRAGTDSNQCYARTMATFRDQGMRPIFIAN